MKASSHPNSSVVAPEATLPVFRTVATNSETEPGSTSAGPTMSSSSDGVAGSTADAGRLLAAGRAGGGASGCVDGSGGIVTGGAATGAEATGGGASVDAASGAVASGAAMANGAGLVGGGVAGIVGAVG